MTRMNIAENKLIHGHKIPRKIKNFGASSSAGVAGDSSGEGMFERGVWKYGMVENEERNKEDKPVNANGTERAKVGYEGNESDATKCMASASSLLRLIGM
jgi:hypothetical protein